MGYVHKYGDPRIGYVDVDVLLGRYRFPGNLKILIKDIEQLTNKEQYNILEELRYLRSKLYTVTREAKYIDFMWKMPLDNNRDLCIENYDSHINFYVINYDEQYISQTISTHDAKKIDFSESMILTSIRQYCLEKHYDHENLLTSALLHSSINTPTRYKHYLFVQGKSVDDDITLD